MRFNKYKNTKSLILLCLLHLFAIVSVFVLLANGQAVFVIKEFIYSLNLGADVHALLARVYVIIKTMFDLPSCFALCLLLIQLLCATWTIRAFILSCCPKKVVVEAEKVDNPQPKIESVSFAKNFSYLENLRLLN